MPEYSAFQKVIYKKFSKLKWGAFKLKNKCESMTKDTFELNNTQKFVTEFLNPTGNGLLLWHSVGSGKTLSAVSIAKKFEQSGYNILWVTRHTLKKDLTKATDLIPLSKPPVVVSYKQFSNIMKHGDRYDKLIKRAHADTIDPLFKTLVVIDEAHKLYDYDLSAQEKHDIHAIEEMIFNSYNVSKGNSCKILLMSATPITKNPLNILRLMNLIIKKEDNRIHVEKFLKDFISSKGTIKSNMEEVFREKTKDLVSYVDITRDPGMFAVTEYNEVFVPISTSDKDLIDCDGGYRLCKNLYPDNKALCDRSLVKCKAKNAKKKELLKLTQDYILATKCTNRN